MGTSHSHTKLLVSGTSKEPNLGSEYNALLVYSYDDGNVSIADTESVDARVFLYADQVDKLIAVLQRHKERTS